MAASWSCCRCTFINGPLVEICEMCENPKPQGDDSATPQMKKRQLNNNQLTAKRKRQTKDQPPPPASVAQLDSTGSVAPASNDCGVAATTPTKASTATAPDTPVAAEASAVAVSEAIPDPRGQLRPVSEAAAGDTKTESVAAGTSVAALDPNSGILKDFFVWGKNGLQSRGVQICAELLRCGWVHRLDDGGAAGDTNDNAVSGIYTSPKLQLIATKDILNNSCEYTESKDYFKSASDLETFVMAVLGRCAVVESDEHCLPAEVISKDSDMDELRMIVRDGVGSVTGTNYFASKFDQLIKNDMPGGHFIGVVVRDPDSGCIIGIVFGSVRKSRRPKAGKVLEGNLDALWVAPANRGAHLGYSLALWFERLIKLKAYSLSVYYGLCEVFTSVRFSRGEDVGDFWTKLGYNLGIGSSTMASKVIDLNDFTDESIFWPTID